MSSNIISNASRWPEINSTPERLGELLNWLRANNIEPNEVPTNASITLEATEGGLVIRHEVYLRNQDGKFYLANPEDDGAGPAREERVTLLAVPPPHDWGVVPFRPAPDAEPEDHGTVVLEIGNEPKPELTP